MSIMVLPLIFAVTLHEAAHAWVADKKGDPTARQLGRITMNPLSHIDPFGTVIIPLLMFASTGFIFGYAKPVPVNPLNLRRPKEDMAWVAAAGPGMNLILAVISGICYRLLSSSFFMGGGGLFSEMGSSATFFLLPLREMLHFSVLINVVLMIFNLIPIPPLDGGRVLVGVLPRAQARLISSIEPYGMFLMVFIVFMDPFGLMRKIVWPLVSTVSGYIFGDFII
ncbi:MAG: site-2 protease family protein [Nitrospirae bacterium]|nr:site-2 protease family protein [Candidatus Manganitrophaceae bacterium]